MWHLATIPLHHHQIFVCVVRVLYKFWSNLNKRRQHSLFIQSELNVDGSRFLIVQFNAMQIRNAMLFKGVILTGFKFPFFALQFLLPSYDTDWFDRFYHLTAFEKLKRKNENHH